MDILVCALLRNEMPAPPGSANPVADDSFPTAQLAVLGKDLLSRFYIELGN